MRPLWVDNTDKIFGIKESWVLHENWVYGEFSTTKVLMSIVAWVRECFDIWSGIDSGKGFDTIVLKSIWDSAVNICGFNWESI